jgi:hypothetical protein
MADLKVWQAWFLLRAIRKDLFVTSLLDVY